MAKRWYNSKIVRSIGPISLLIAFRYCIGEIREEIHNTLHYEFAEMEKIERQNKFQRSRTQELRTIENMTRTSKVEMSQDEINQFFEENKEIKHFLGENKGLKQFLKENYLIKRR